ncbi:HipA N-terminal domain-containing protein [Pseudomonas sp. TE3610]
MRPLQRVRIQTPKGESGELSHDQDYLFHYGIGARAGQQISLTMGVRDMPYESRGLHPVFQMTCRASNRSGLSDFLMVRASSHTRARRHMLFHTDPGAHKKPVPILRHWNVCPAQERKAHSIER